MTEIQYTCIETTRLEQLIRAENDANMLKAFIANAHDRYDSIDYGTLKILYTLFIGEKEEEK